MGEWSISSPTGGSTASVNNGVVTVTENNTSTKHTYVVQYREGDHCGEYTFYQEAGSGPTPPQPGEGVRGTFTKLILKNATGSQVTIYSNGLGKMYIPNPSGGHYSLIYNLNGQTYFDYHTNCNTIHESVDNNGVLTFNNVPFEVEVGDDSRTLDELTGCSFENNSASIWGAGQNYPLDGNSGTMSSESGGAAIFKDGGSYIISFSEINNTCFTSGGQQYCYDTSKTC